MAIESKRVTAILLAAGRSERFGGDKLAYPVAGQALAHHAAQTLASIDFARRIAVVGPTSAAFGPLGFDVVVPPQGLPLSASIVAGIERASDTDCDACLIALADMPLMPGDHFRALMSAHASDVTATRNGARNMVPALFSRAMFPALRQLSGDRGAADMLVGSNFVIADATWMMDVDSRADIARLLQG